MAIRRTSQVLRAAKDANHVPPVQKLCARRGRGILEEVRSGHSRRAYQRAASMHEKALSSHPRGVAVALRRSALCSLLKHHPAFEARRCELPTLRSSVWHRSTKTESWRFV